MNRSSVGNEVKVIGAVALVYLDVLARSPHSTRDTHRNRRGRVFSHLLYASMPERKLYPLCEKENIWQEQGYT
jgi:hypothetical protein